MNRFIVKRLYNTETKQYEYIVRERERKSESCEMQYHDDITSFIALK